jgi:predicted RNase H-like HicB family nuclease
MTHYVALLEDAGPAKAVGIWFPDLPGCFSGGDTLDEAIAHAPEAVALWLDAVISEGRAIPRARPPSEIRSDPKVAADIAAFGYALMLIPAPTMTSRPAA